MAGQFSRGRAIAGVVVGVAGLSLSLLVANDSAACGNVMRTVQTIDADVGIAEREVGTGDLAGGLNLLRNAFGDIGEVEPPRDSVPTVVRRAVIVSARAVAHSNGMVSFAPSMVRLPLAKLGVKDPLPGPEVGALKTAAFWLEHIALDRPEDPGARADVAEIDARIPEKRAAAEKTLSDLEERDVVPSGWAYAALATLRKTKASDQPAWLGAPLRTLVYAQAALDDARCARMLKSAKSCDAWADGLEADPNHF